MMNWLARFKSKTPTLGARELSVLNLLWSKAPLSASDVHQHFLTSGIGLNTIQSTLERLYRKQILTRSKSGRTFLYQPSLTQTELIGVLIAEIQHEIAEGDMNLVISGFETYLDEYKNQATERDSVSIGSLDQNQQTDQNPECDD
jgi:predicted transcriptional regulator